MVWGKAEPLAVVGSRILFTDPVFLEFGFCRERRRGVTFVYLFE